MLISVSLQYVVLGENPMKKLGDTPPCANFSEVHAQIQDTATFGEDVVFLISNRMYTYVNGAPRLFAPVKAVQVEKIIMMASLAFLTESHRLFAYYLTGYVEISLQNVIAADVKSIAYIRGMYFLSTPAYVFHFGSCIYMECPLDIGSDYWSDTAIRVEVKGARGVRRMYGFYEVVIVEDYDRHLYGLGYMQSMCAFAPGYSAEFRHIDAVKDTQKVVVSNGSMTAFLKGGAMFQCTSGQIVNIESPGAKTVDFDAVNDQIVFLTKKGIFGHGIQQGGTCLSNGEKKLMYIGEYKDEMSSVDEQQGAFIFYGKGAKGLGEEIDEEILVAIVISSVVTFIIIVSVLKWLIKRKKAQKYQEL